MKTAQLKEIFWDAVRPIHSPLTRAARRRLGRNYFSHPEMELPPAYEAVQLEVERRLHCYLHLASDQIENIVIVGANNGSEIGRLRHSYPRARFLCFEPSPRWFLPLSEAYRSTDFVECRELALGDSPGRATFYELPMAGNGSLLEPDIPRWSAFNNTAEGKVESFAVEVSTLDLQAAHLDQVHLLWVDVQGAEDAVLRGGRETLGRTAAVLLEVALRESPYRGAKLFPDLNAMLAEDGFACVGLGIDGSNYSGNALWIRNIAGIE